ncbi:MAG: endonuclease/exonuclease/phosphatase family protein [Gemmatimonadetes bacterium]|nr:endonuclease/exonuclease/phosphatase family protein [Gemmatimonadota bacterium]
MVRHTVAFWNLENLFDVAGSPRRSDKLERALRSELSGWTQAVLDRKIEQLASVIRQMNQGAGPDLLGVCEVENRQVLELLREALQPLGRDYEIVHADARDGRGIDVAFLHDATRFTPTATFFHFIVKRYATRDIVQVNFRTAAGRPLVVVGNHWPSRSGGRWETEPFRLIAGETLGYFHERIRDVHGNDTPVLAMGDFNDEPGDRSLEEHARSFRQRAKVTRATSAAFLNLMWPAVGAGLGTHYFDNVANVLDQFLVSRPLLTGSAGIQVEADSATIVQLPEMITGTVYPQPRRYGRQDDVDPDGFSDHFPITVTLDED